MITYCPNCTAKVKFPVERENTKGKCPGCGLVFTLIAVGENLPSAPITKPTSKPVIVTPNQPVHAAPPHAPTPALTKDCFFCGEAIAHTAIKCKHCNEFLDGRPRQQTIIQQPIIQQHQPIYYEEPKRDLRKSKREMEQMRQQRSPSPNQTMNISQVVNVGAHSYQKWSRVVAGVLSLVFPGLGHLYKRQPFSGLLWAILVIIGYVAFVVPGAILHVICILGSMTGDTHR